MSVQLLPANPPDLSDRPLAPQVEGPTVSELASDISDEAQKLVEQHGTLLKAELKESGEMGIRSAVLIGAGAVGMVIGGLFLLIGLIRLTAWSFPTLPEWASWLIWGGSVVLLAGIALFLGARTLTRMSLVPHRTLGSLWESWKCLLKRRK
jgi:hypothetical protein